MADQGTPERKRKPGVAAKIKATRQRVTRSDNNVKKRPEKEELKARYMASPHWSWEGFCQAEGMDARATRSYYPVSAWTQEKRTVIARVMADDLSADLFKYRKNWHKDVLRTLHDYPAAHDTMMNIIKTRMADMVHDIRIDQEEFKATGKNPKNFAKNWDTGSINSLASALKTVTESRYRSLMLHDWKVEMHEAELDRLKDEAGAMNEKQTRDISVTVVGGDQSTMTDLMKFMANYYDKPQQAVETETGNPDEPQPEDKEAGVA